MIPENKVQTRTQFDTVWTWTGSTAVATGVFVFILLSTGSDNLFQPAQVPQEDWLVVNRAYFGALFMAVFLWALGVIALRAQHICVLELSPAWPRFQLLEGKEGPRDRLIATAGFLVVILLPTVVLYTSLYAYMRKSVVVEYQGLAKLGDGFWGSRVNTFSVVCEEAPCFRFYQHEKSFQWFWFSDAGLLIAVVGALLTWALFVTITVSQTRIR